MHGRDDDARLQQIASDTRTCRIAALNDALRRHRTGGRLVTTAGVMALGQATVEAILRQVADFTAFDDGNDPNGEHDFGSFDHAGDRLFWKIDYYDSAMAYASPDPTDPEVTTRVLTIMLAEEY